MTNTHKLAPIPFCTSRCYACSAVAVGVRDRRPEGGMIEAACKRHADPTIPTFPGCMYCNGRIRPGSVAVDADFAHAKCHAEACL